MNVIKPTPIVAALAVATVAALLAATPAGAIDKCKAKVARDGTIEVSASGIEGGALWGKTATSVNGLFFVVGGCADSPDKLKKCLIGAPGSHEAKLPPAGCELFLADGGTNDCSTYIKGCTSRNSETYGAEFDLEGTSISLDEEVGFWIAGLVHDDTGDYSVSFTPDAFSETPVCTASIYRLGFLATDPSAFTVSVSNVTSSGLQLHTFDQTQATSDCGSVLEPCAINLICTGR